jgi:hypothetical protein
MGLPKPQELEAVCDITQLLVIPDTFAQHFPSSFLIVWYYVAEVFVS